MAYQIFISFKNEWQEKPTRDSEIAQELYNELKKYGIEVFFSNEEVQRKGRPDYGELINEALEQSVILMLVGTRAEFTDSRWVKYEWNLFNNEIYSARKDGKIITVLEGMDVGELPIGMRQWQSYDLKKFNVSDAVKMAVSTLETLMGQTYVCSESTEEKPIPEESSMTAEELREIGRDYYYGRNGKIEDKKEAVRYYRIAAELGDAEAQCALGDCYLLGTEVAKDEKAAVRYYRMAAKQRYAPALCNLGVCYEYGKGVGMRIRRAAYYYRMAARQGNAMALCNLGIYCEYYRRGWRIEELTVRYFKMASEKGLANAHYWLGVCYDVGKGVTEDEKEAVRYYRLAAEQGHALALQLLGWKYLRGIGGVAKDEKEAVRYYRMAAEQGNKAAQINLGACYRDGTGVAKDEKEAKYWFSRAAEQDYENEKEMLERLA